MGTWTTFSFSKGSQMTQSHAAYNIYTSNINIQAKRMENYKNLPTKKSPDPEVSTTEFYQIYKKEYQFFTNSTKKKKKTEEKETHLMTSVLLILKPDSDLIIKEIKDQYPS